MTCTWVSLLVRLWVEMTTQRNVIHGLKCQPPREAVSWNKGDPKAEVEKMCQPPREAVSWNEQALGNEGRKPTSASSWGCELKYAYESRQTWRSSQPPREAVSWNDVAGSYVVGIVVSLLVRLWVEMSRISCRQHKEIVSLLVRLWVEISSRFFPVTIVKVSLLVRLWVEIWNSRLLYA